MKWFPGSRSSTNTPQNNNWEYFGAPMESRQGNHDTNSKVFLGINLPAGQSVEQDLDGLLDGLMQHPNIAPCIATRLIRSLVTSNPSGPFVERVAQKFVDNGQGVRGDLKAVLKAILLDPEARQDVAGPTHGRLKDPILQIAGFLRALDGQFNPGQQVTYLFDNLGQSVLNPPSVFSWFSPLYRIPKSALFGPEFQIHSPTEATLRGNFIHAILSQPNGGDVTIDLSPFQAYGNDMPGLVEAANQRLLYGRMTPSTPTAPRADRWRCPTTTVPCFPSRHRTARPTPSTRGSKPSIRSGRRAGSPCLRTPECLSNPSTVRRSLPGRRMCRRTSSRTPTRSSRCRAAWDPVPVAPAGPRAPWI